MKRNKQAKEDWFDIPYMIYSFVFGFAYFIMARYTKILDGRGMLFLIPAWIIMLIFIWRGER